MRYKPPSLPGPGKYEIHYGDAGEHSHVATIKARSLPDVILAVNLECDECEYAMVEPAQFTRHLRAGDRLTDPEGQRWEIGQDSFHSLDHPGLTLYGPNHHMRMAERPAESLETPQVITLERERER